MTEQKQTPSQTPMDTAEMTSLKSRLQEMWAEQLGVSPNDVLDDSLLKELGADSLDMEELIMELEDSGIAPDMSEVPRNELSTIREFSQKIMEQINAD